MSPETDFGKHADLVELLNTRDRIPNIIKQTMLTLAEDGLLDKNDAKRLEIMVEAKSDVQARAFHLLILTTQDLLTAPDSHSEGFYSAKMAWLMYFTKITPEFADRTKLINEIFDNYSDLDPEIDVSKARDEVTLALGMQSSRST